MLRLEGRKYYLINRLYLWRPSLLSFIVIFQINPSSISRYKKGVGVVLNQIKDFSYFISQRSVSVVCVNTWLPRHDYHLPKPITVLEVEEKGWIKGLNINGPNIRRSFLKPSLDSSGSSLCIAMNNIRIAREVFKYTTSEWCLTLTSTYILETSSLNPFLLQ